MYAPVMHYATNCEFVAACIACGDGGTEARRILGILDLLNYATMEKYSFPCLEYYIGGQICYVCTDALEANMLEEVRLSSTEDASFL